MQTNNLELILAFLTIAIFTTIYAAVVLFTGSIPAASEFFGHSLGVLGFLLMIMTEVLYSLRKRSRSARWGRMSTWLQFHIFTGLVGPYLVLLHSSWKFNGLAGVVMLLTVVIVASGFVGRYIYTAVPRTADGIALEAEQIKAQAAEIEEAMQASQKTRPGMPRRLLESSFVPESAGESAMTILGRGFSDLKYRWDWRRQQRSMSTEQREQARELAALANRRRTLQRQLASLGMTRRLLAVWHTVHIPIGVVLFTAAFVHIVGAVYFATLLH